MEIKKFTRRQFPVTAVQVTPDNLDEVAAWCDGEVKETNARDKFVHVKVHRPQNTKQTRAFPGDWVSLSEQGYKVYTDKAFTGAFEQSEDGEVLNVFNDTEELRVTDEPVPAEPVVEEKLEEPEPTTSEKLGFNTPKNLMKD